MNNQKKPHPLSPEQKERNRPVTGGLYRALRGSHPGAKKPLLKGNIVMVTSKQHQLLDKRRPTAGDQITTSYEWVDLYVLFEEQVYNFSTFTETDWYEWFERVETSKEGETKS